MDSHCQCSRNHRDDPSSRLCDDAVNRAGVASFETQRFAEVHHQSRLFSQSDKYRHILKPIHCSVACSDYFKCSAFNI